MLNVWRNAVVIHVK